MTNHPYTLSDLPTLAAALLAENGHDRTYALVGDLGAGKTTLVSEMCRILGVAEPTSSPTFSIVNQYEGADLPVFHLDCYRLESIEEALDAGLEELLAEEGRTVFVEWPAVIEPLLPQGVVYLHLRHAPDGAVRYLTISTGHPPRHE